MPKVNTINSDLLISVIFIAVVIVSIIIIFCKNKENNLKLNNIKNKLGLSPSPSYEGFENDSNKLMNNNQLATLKKENQELRSYMKVHGLYPEGKKLDMSKYILKSNVEPEKICPDMSKYMLKASVPEQVKCPEINRDDWIRKSELPPNWNKDCPAHPDLTNYVLKSTIPPTQKCPPCICPKIKVNAGLCREPNKDDCLKTGILDEACPKPKPCEIPKCPEPQPCPKPEPPTPCPRPPPPPKCPELKCPSPPKQGKCPQPERCPPTQNCPKCYDVKYLKVPVVKSEGIPKPEKQTIFPTNLIETKLVRSQVEEQPRMPRIVSLKDGNMRNNNNNNNNNDNDNEIPPQLVTDDDEDIALAPASSRFLSYSKDLSNKRNGKKNNKKNNKVNQKQNRKPVRNHSGKCNKVKLDNAYNKYGVTGFNNVL